MQIRNQRNRYYLKTLLPELLLEKEISVTIWCPKYLGTLYTFAISWKKFFFRLHWNMAHLRGSLRRIDCGYARPWQTFAIRFTAIFVNENCKITHVWYTAMAHPIIVHTRNRYHFFSLVLLLSNRANFIKLACT